MLGNVSYCIFDLDGLLIDSESIYTKVTQKLCDEHGGLPYTFEIKRKVMGLQEARVAEILIKDLQLQLTVEQYIEKMGVLQRDAFRNTPLMPGAENLIRHLSKNKIPIAVCTSSSRWKCDIKMSRHKDLFSLFDIIVCGDDPSIKRNKPFPDPYLITKSYFGENVNSNNCLVFEDAVIGLESGLAAGMYTVFVPDPQLTEKHSYGAHQVLNSLEDFKPELWGLPSI